MELTTTDWHFLQLMQEHLRNPEILAAQAVDASLEMVRRLNEPDPVTLQPNIDAARAVGNRLRQS